MIITLSLTSLWHTREVRKSVGKEVTAGQKSKKHLQSVASVQKQDAVKSFSRSAVNVDIGDSEKEEVASEMKKKCSASAAAASTAAPLKGSSSEPRASVAAETKKLNGMLNALSINLYRCVRCAPGVTGRLRSSFRMGGEHAGQ